MKSRRITQQRPGEWNASRRGWTVENPHGGRKKEWRSHPPSPGKGSDPPFYMCDVCVERGLSHVCVECLCHAE